MKGEQAIVRWSCGSNGSVVEMLIIVMRVVDKVSICRLGEREKCLCVQ